MRVLYAVAGIGMLLGLAAVLGAQTGSAGAQAASTALPKDVDPQSFSRLPVVKRDEMDEDGKRIYDELAGGPGKTESPGLRGGGFGGRARVRPAVRMERARDGRARRQSAARGD
jgi:hypothetical protein